MGELIHYFKNSNETDSKLLNEAKVEFGVAVLPAQVCKKCLQNKSSQGLKSDWKHCFQEQEQKVKNHHFHVRY